MEKIGGKIVEKKKKKRGCCFVFLILLLVIIALIAGGLYLITSDKLDDILEANGEKVEETVYVFDELDYDMAVTGEVGTEFRNAVDDFVEFAEAYCNGEKVFAENDIPKTIYYYIKTTLKASKVRKDIEKLKDNTYTLSDYKYYYETVDNALQNIEEELSS